MCLDACCGSALLNELAIHACADGMHDHACTMHESSVSAGMLCGLKIHVHMAVPSSGAGRVVESGGSGSPEVVSRESAAQEHGH
jgi:hypothetical protein